MSDTPAPAVLSTLDTPDPERPHARVGRVTLNRPERRNALRAADARAIAAAIRELHDQGARAIIIAGAGPVFCAGADLSGGVYAADFWAGIEDMLTTITTTPIPIIAEITGAAVGAGCQLAIACDLRVMHPDARIWIPVADHGFALDVWTHDRLRELLGGAWARYLLMTGEPLSLADAAPVGFAVAAESATPLAASLAAKAPLAIAHVKGVLNRPGVVDAEETSRWNEAGNAVWASADAEEARRARAEGRPPLFEGR